MMFKAALLACLVGALLVFATSAGNAAPSVLCDVVASPTGSDAAAGTAEQPVKTVSRALNLLDAGQTACLRSGTYAGRDGGNGSKLTSVDTPGVTLTSFPGERASLTGQLKLQEQAHGATVSDLDIDGRNSGAPVSILIIGDDTTLAGNDITNDHQEICVIIAGWNGARVKRSLIEGNRIHDCGRRPSQNQDHGIYVSHADDTVIRDNWIYDNVDRGIQLYPNAQRTLIEGNVIDGNGEGISFGGDDGVSSSNATVRSNVISNSRLRYNVESYYPAGTPAGSNNQVANNCIYGATKNYQTQDGSGIADGAGFDASNNLVAKPQFVDRASGNLTLAADSPCSAMLATSSGTTPPTSTDPLDGTIRIAPNSHHVRSGQKVHMRGSVTEIAHGRATVVQRRHGNWVKVGGGRISGSGSFSTTTRRVWGHRASFRALVANVGKSRIARVRVRPRHRHHGHHHRHHGQHRFHGGR